MAELIQKNDSLNTGREKLNEAIKDSNKAKVDAEQALNVANQSLAQSENTQEQLNQVVVEGDSSVEAAQARVDAENNTYPTLKARLDSKETEFSSQLAQKASKRELSDMVGNIADGTPLFANSISEMTDTTRIYLNVSDGFLYVHDGNGFTNTGVAYLSNSIEEYMYYEGQGWSE